MQGVHRERLAKCCVSLVQGDRERQHKRTPLFRKLSIIYQRVHGYILQRDILMAKTDKRKAIVKQVESQIREKYFDKTRCRECKGTGVINSSNPRYTGLTKTCAFCAGTGKVHIVLALPVGKYD